MGDCFDEKTRDALSKIGADAYRWRQSIQTSPIDQEFQATMFGSEGTYSDDDMRLDTGQTDGLEVNPKLVACVGLGLRSVTVTGPHQPPQATRYMKAVVVTEKYF